MCLSVLKYGGVWEEQLLSISFSERDVWRPCLTVQIKEGSVFISEVKEVWILCLSKWRKCGLGVYQSNYKTVVFISTGLKIWRRGWKEKEVWPVYLFGPVTVVWPLCLLVFVSAYCRRHDIFLLIYKEKVWPLPINPNGETVASVY